jgi:precorrin-6B methylase 2
MRKLKRAVKACLKPLYDRLPHDLRTVVHHMVHRLVSTLAAPTMRVSVAKLAAEVELLRGCMVENDRVLLALLRSLPAKPALPELRFSPLPVGDQRLLIPHPADSFMYLDTRDVKAAPRLLLDSREQQVPAVLQRLVQPGDVVVEVNAHQGFHTLTLARRATPAGRVIAIEPDPLCRSVLQDNLAVHQLTGAVTVLPQAVEPIGICDFVRLDAGGDEAAVLEELWPLLQGRREIRILFALCPSAKAAALLDWFARLGMRFWQVIDGDLREQSADDLLDGLQQRIDVVAARSAQW